MIRRHGDIAAFWGLGSPPQKEPTGTYGSSNAPGAPGVSRPAWIGQAVGSLAIYVTVDNATTITVQCAHMQRLDSEGIDPDTDDNIPTTWGDLYHIQVSAGSTTTTMVFTGAATQVLNIPSIAPGWFRLRSSGNVNAIAGYEVISQ